VKTVLVAGGAGFLGSHLCRFLLADSEVVCVDNLITGRRENLADLFDRPGFTFVEHDILRPLDIQAPVREIYNLACPASPRDYRSLPLETLATCSIGVHNLLELADRMSARFLQTSTSEVYGDPLEHPQTETYFGNVNPIGERSAYDEGKRFAESLVVHFGRTKSLSVAVARIFNTYGPGMRSDDGRAIPTFISQAALGQSLTVFGDGTRTRSFCYVSDMIDGLVRLMAADETGPVNLGNPTEISIRDLAEMIIKITGSRSTIGCLEPAADDPRRRRPDISLAKDRLGWEPSVDLSEGLAKTVLWYQGQGKAGRR
jgi:nucleoside-diphosphate-sugar epimerase